MLNVLITIVLHLLYIDNHLSYKRNDPNIYKKNELESTFIEIVNPKTLLWESITDNRLRILLPLIAMT